jgi:hypothetical protein
MMIIATKLPLFKTGGEVLFASYWTDMRLFFYLVCETIGTAATPGLLCQPRVIVKMIVESKIPHA